MRPNAKFASVISSFLLLTLSLRAQQPAPQQSTPTPLQRDSQALGIVAQAFRALGGTVPSDSVANGTVDIIAGSTRDHGTILILTRDLDQTLEEISTSTEVKKVTYSKMLASQTMTGTMKHLPMELVVTSQSAWSPLILLARALSNSTVSAQYIGLEVVAGVQSQHIRTWDTFTADPMLFHLSDFSVRDFWLDASSGLPIIISYDEKDSVGPSPKIHCEFMYSDFRQAGPMKVPFVITKKVNGVLHAMVHLDTVTLNNGLTDDDFSLR
jgi:hypothetical protein